MYNMKFFILILFTIPNLSNTAKLDIEWSIVGGYETVTVYFGGLTFVQKCNTAAFEVDDEIVLTLKGYDILGVPFVFKT